MQTELLANSDKLPRLEYHANGGEAPDCSPLLSQPFSIGRVDSADLQVDSNRVSREHAVIEQHGLQWRVRDLGSTNGTFLNGEQITEGWLTDGDILTIADTDFTFFSGEVGQSHNTATQLMDDNGAPPIRSGRDVIASVRRLNEMALQRAFSITLRPLINLADDAIDGWSMVSPHAGPADAQSIVNDSTAALAVRFRQLARVTAIKEFKKRRLVEQLMFGIKPIELDDISILRSHLQRLNDDVPESFSLIASLPGQAYESDKLQSLRRVLDELGIGLAFESAVFNGKQILEYAEARPSHVILKSNSFSEILSRRPSTQQLASLIASFIDIGCQPIADATSEDDDSRVLQDLGFHFGFRDTESQELATTTTAETHQCEPEGVPSNSAQSTQAEIAKVTARIRASWSK